jgi:hypothetical protein
MFFKVPILCNRILISSGDKSNREKYGQKSSDRPFFMHGQQIMSHFISDRRSSSFVRAETLGHDKSPWQNLRTKLPINFAPELSR